MSSIVSFPSHLITILVGGFQIGPWESYEIKISMTEPDGHIAMRMPFSRDAWDACLTDTVVRVMIDDVNVITVRLDERLVPEDEPDTIEINGRNAAARLVQESAPSLSFAGLDMFTLIEKVATPWVEDIVFSNARNRRVLRGRGKKARAAGEPVVIKTRRSIGDHIEPGQSRWEVIQNVCSQAGYLAWVSGDGNELIVGEPNYGQEVQFRFFYPKADSTRPQQSTVLGMGVRDSILSRYSRIVVVGSGTGTDANYGATVAALYGEAKNNPATPDGEGIDFFAPKRLIVVRPVANQAEAKELATREMAKRDATGDTITVRAQGHGQVIAGTYTTIFAPDTLASVEHEPTGTKGVYLITSCTYRCHRKGGEETLLELVPKGTVLTS